MKERFTQFKAKAKEVGRELLDVPEKVAIAAGLGGLLVSTIYPPALMPSILLIGTGAGSMMVTETIAPKKKFKAQKA